jgi:outer membrane protein assembly factor BamB
VISGSRSYDLEALDSRQGTPIWKKYFWFSWVESSPAVFGGLIYIGSSDAAKVFAVDARSGRSVWEVDAGGNAWGRPSVTATTVYEGVTGVTHYIAPHRGSMLALDRKTGAVRWRYPIAEPQSDSKTMASYGFAGAVALGNGLVFAGGLDGRLYAFDQ